MKLEGMLVQSDNRDDREKVIDENLRRVFDETLEEGIPDRFKELLSQLKKQESGEGSRG
ncbi:NepR family anti-sigma factor [Sulfitobacter sp. HI0129]|uniref:NepR family anti-sigma factor n=1 Tax=Sulfitobacter sp. HI0129 TaxID=1822268 RepID=UPI002E815C5E|nr:NepR family anti-sigma factor [Sulfitobacter sp. HI0129]